jgi:predicted nucleotidyltransferase
MQLNRIIKDFFASGYGHIAAVYLFGSCATERQRESSDADIGLLLQPDAADLPGDVLEDILVKLPRLLRRDVHPVVMNTAPEELLRQIFDKGRCVLVNDEKTLAHFEMNAFAKIADFGYYRRRLQQGVIRNVLEGVPVG